MVSSHSSRVNGTTRAEALPVASDHEDQVEALRLLVELLESGEAECMPVRVACDDGTIMGLEVGASEEERQEILAILRRQLSRILH